MNGMRKAHLKNKRESKYLITPDSRLGSSFLSPCIRNAQNLPKVIKAFLADIKRTMSVQAFMMVGYIGKNDDQHSTMSVIAPQPFLWNLNPISGFRPSQWKGTSPSPRPSKIGTEMHGSSGRAMCSLNSVSGHLHLSHKNLALTHSCQPLIVNMNNWVRRMV